MSKVIPVTATICTRDRYFTTLPLAISAVAMQTYVPQALGIYDDGEGKDLREFPMYLNLLKLLDAKGIKWWVETTPQIGQVKNHQKALETAETDWIWRLDDDNIPEPNVLESLYEKATLNDKIGAVGSCVIEPKQIFPCPGFTDGSILNSITGLNIQWFTHTPSTAKIVEHLYSTFLYRKIAGVGGYCKELSPVGHREETLFTYQMYRAGWKLLVDPSVITWHLREPSGGIRAGGPPKEWWDMDESFFRKQLTERWKVVLPTVKLIVLNNGLGDHLIFRRVFPKIKEYFPDCEFLAAVCYPQVFEDVQIGKIISIADVGAMGVDLGKYDLYGFCARRNWTKPIEDAYIELYTQELKNDYHCKPL